MDTGGRTMKEQQILNACNHYEQLDRCLKNSGQKKILLVCGSSIRYFHIGRYFDTLESRLGIKVVRFGGFTPNPLYGSVAEGVRLLNREHIRLIAAVGGGSAMDVAKCIKLYADMDHSRSYLQQTIVPNDIRLIAVPTTAGTGSEATRYAVIYENGEKQSVSDDSCIPDAVVVDPSVLKSLPLYQKKATMMDALCHSIEACWSIHSSEESRQYSRTAIEQIVACKDAYLKNTEQGNAGMLRAANMAGKAINLAQTTAGHAMCYRLTGLYRIAHGHAAALCVSRLFPYMIKNPGPCAAPGGEAWLKERFAEIAGALGCKTAVEGAERFDGILKELALGIPKAGPDDYERLKTSVNPDRLKNNPVRLDTETIDCLYHQILSGR